MDPLVALFEYLSPDPVVAGERYEALRRSLTKYFEIRRVVFSDELTDATLDRVAQRLNRIAQRPNRGSEIDDFTELTRYCHGVARLVLLEYFRNTHIQLVPIEEINNVDWIAFEWPQPLHEQYEEEATATTLEHWLYLREAWTIIGQLPLKQRKALLLGLKDEEEESALRLLIESGIVTYQQAAEALKISAEQLTELWEDLPLHDVRIANLLKLSRQQVINLRKAARVRLDRWWNAGISQTKQDSVASKINEKWSIIEATVIQPLLRVDSLGKMAGLKHLPIEGGYLPEGLNTAQRHITIIATLAQDYLTRRTQAGKLTVMEELGRELESFLNAMVLIQPPVGSTFQIIASRWLAIIQQLEKECRWQLSFTSIPNPYVAGNPLQQRDHDLFKGRKDIIIAIEENIINPSQRPALLLYGRRRIGKTSTLLNLPRLLSSQFTPVFVDCQNAKWRDGDAAFCYHLANSVYGELYQRNLLDGLGKPVLEQFEKYAFTRLDGFLDQVETLSRRINKQILLTFDEYEAMEQGITTQKITHEVFNQLRNIIQHRERIVVIFSGSHRFEELRVVNWSDYLINVKTLELSFLAPEDARELLIEPVPTLHYEPGVVDAIIALTHCQPYLLQAVATDLVNYLNTQKRQTATMADLDVAVAKVLVTADAYFHNNWAECSDDEREALRALATDKAVNTQVEQHQRAWQSLSRKEIVEMGDGRYGFAVELFRLWILKNQIPAFQSNS